jgi:DNA polymerase-3 subunit chi
VTKVDFYTGSEDKLPPTAFMPHCHSHETGAATMPVLIGCDETFHHSELLISLHNVCLPFFSRFERVIEIVSQDDDDAKQGRDRYKFYKDRGYEMRHFDLRQKQGA